MWREIGSVFTSLISVLFLYRQAHTHTHTHLVLHMQCSLVFFTSCKSIWTVYSCTDLNALFKIVVMRKKRSSLLNCKLSAARGDCSLTSEYPIWTWGIKEHRVQCSRYVLYCSVGRGDQILQSNCTYTYSNASSPISKIALQCSTHPHCLITSTSNTLQHITNQNQLQGFS